MCAVSRLLAFASVGSFSPAASSSSILPKMDIVVFPIDPCLYDDYVYPDGKLGRVLPRLPAGTDTVAHIKALVKAMRVDSVPINHHPHQPWKMGNCDAWNHTGPLSRHEQEIDRVG